MSARCRQHYRLYCPSSACAAEAERNRKSSSTTRRTNDGAGEIGINTEGNLTIGMGGGLTMDATDGSIGIRTSPGFSIDTPSSSDYSSGSSSSSYDSGSSGGGGSYGD